jgi:hypothetical protein
LDVVSVDASVSDSPTAAHAVVDEHEIPKVVAPEGSVVAAQVEPPLLDVSRRSLGPLEVSDVTQADVVGQAMPPTGPRSGSATARHMRPPLLDRSAAVVPPLDWSGPSRGPSVVPTHSDVEGHTTPANGPFLLGIVPALHVEPAL